jgi:hypothetical protein
MPIDGISDSKHCLTLWQLKQSTVHLYWKLSWRRNFKIYLDSIWLLWGEEFHCSLYLWHLTGVLRGVIALHGFFSLHVFPKRKKKTSTDGTLEERSSSRLSTNGRSSSQSRPYPGLWTEEGQYLAQGLSLNAVLFMILTIYICDLAVICKELILFSCFQIASTWRSVGARADGDIEKQDKRSGRVPRRLPAHVVWKQGQEAQYDSDFGEFTVQQLG